MSHIVQRLRAVAFSPCPSGRHRCGVPRPILNEVVPVRSKNIAQIAFDSTRTELISSYVAPESLFAGCRRLTPGKPATTNVCSTGPREHPHRSSASAPAKWQSLRSQCCGESYSYTTCIGARQRRRRAHRSTDDRPSAASIRRDHRRQALLIAGKPAPAHAGLRPREHPHRPSSRSSLHRVVEGSDTTRISCMCGGRECRVILSCDECNAMV
ncbi:hypothetical protein B0H14DRAFT_366590 [Mycena olivaceomarginata]|nr:hypothetical protein B0H14DRAFT_366590 [Mycena olivaceomarginata]